MILMIDNYDSFTYNVYQYIGSLYPQIQVVRNDESTIEEIKNLQNLEAISLEEGFLEHIKEDSKELEYERLKPKIQELFSKYEELSYDTN